MAAKGRSAMFMVGAVIAALAAGAAGGWAAGHAQGFKAAFSFLETEVQGGLAFRTEALCRLRLGQQEGAIQLMEMRLDQAVQTIPQGRPVSELPKQAQSSLMAAKVYRAAYGGGAPEASEVLRSVPMPTDAGFCDQSGVRQVFEMLREKRDGAE